MNLSNEYLDPRKAGSFTGLSKFKKELEKRKIKVPNRVIKDYLKQKNLIQYINIYQKKIQKK
jgi:hypothetical protein